MERVPASEPRAYNALRTIVGRHGGTMEHRREGFPQGGVWVITIADGTAVIESNGAGYPPLDSLYVPRVTHPKHYRDYGFVLVADAEVRLLKLLKHDPA